MRIIDRQQAEIEKLKRLVEEVRTTKRAEFAAESKYVGQTVKEEGVLSINAGEIEILFKKICRSHIEVIVKLPQDLMVKTLKPGQH